MILGVIKTAMKTSVKMENLKTLETQVLIDILVQQTEKLTSKIAERDSVELRQYEYEISLIQAELNSRKQNERNTSLTDPDKEFTSGTN